MNKIMAEETTDKTATEVKAEEEMTADELKALHEDEDFIANFKEEDKEDPEKVTKFNEAMARSAQTTIAQKRHYRTKFQELSTKKPDEKPPVVTPQDKKDEKKVDPALATDFRLDHPELTKEQQLKVIAHAGAYGTTPEEALKDPLIQSFIEKTNVKEDVEEGSPSPSRKAGGSIADKDWSGASPAEMEAARNKMLFPNG